MSNSDDEINVNDDDESIHSNGGSDENDSDEMSSDSFYSHSNSESDDDDSDDEFNSDAFEHYILNFCGGEYDDTLKGALNNFRANDTGNYDINQTTNADWDARKAFALEGLKAQMQSYVGAVDTGIDVEKIFDHITLTSVKHRLGQQRYGLILAHEHSLDPYWDDFLNALTRYSYDSGTKFRYIVIQDVELTKEILEKMATKLNGKVKKALIFNGNNICREGIISIASLLEGNRTMGYLHLCQSPINDLSGVMRLSEAVSTHPIPLSLNLSGCSIGTNMDILMTILRSGAETIYLNDNDIGSQGAIEIAKHLQSNASTLKQLSLDTNRLNDGDAILLAQALKKNTNLQEIWVRGNNFSVSGVKSLFKAIFNSSSLNAISESNHQCQLHLFSEMDTSQDYVEILNSQDRDTSRMRKISVAFHSRESTLHYLEGLPLEFMPDVLDEIQAETEENKLINMMYAIMRWWDMPALYSYHRCATSRYKRKRGAN